MAGAWDDANTGRRLACGYLDSLLRELPGPGPLVGVGFFQNGECWDVLSTSGWYLGSSSGTCPISLAVSPRSRDRNLRDLIVILIHMIGAVDAELDTRDHIRSLSMRCLIVGQAKSGTTAVYSLISSAMGQPAGHFEDPIEAIPPLPADSVVKVILEHETEAAVKAFARGFDHRLALVRDPRDVIISSLMFFYRSRKGMLANDRFVEDFIQIILKKQKKPLSVELKEIFSLIDGFGLDFLEICLNHIKNCADFINGLDDGWFVLRYEDLVSGNVEKLSRHIGLSLDDKIEVAPEYSGVARTKAAGDWRNWFSPADVEWLRPKLDPLMVRLGYDLNWDLPDLPVITPEHSWSYLVRGIQQRRALYDLPAPPEVLQGLDLFQEEVRLAREAGILTQIWWRDDDLIANTANFDTLLRLARAYAAPVLMAIIPGLVDEGLNIRDADPALIHFCQHGWKHINHQPAGVGKSEFGPDRDPGEIIAEIAAGQVALARILGDRRLPIFVPPWNAFNSRHMEILQVRGFSGLSVHGSRPQSFAIDGVRLANTHIDILRWDAPGQPQALALEDVFGRLALLVRKRRLAPGADPEPIGLLSHHRAMADDAWALMNALFSTIREMPGIAWVAPPRVFAAPK